MLPKKERKKTTNKNGARTRHCPAKKSGAVAAMLFLSITSISVVFGLLISSLCIFLVYFGITGFGRVELAAQEESILQIEGDDFSASTFHDNDNDGFYEEASDARDKQYEFDCDDTNPLIYPGASNPYCDCDTSDGFGQGRPEICGTGIDENCDGEDPLCESTTVPPRQGSLGGDLNEASGLVASLQYPGVYWVHNDSGDSARIFAVYDDGSVIREVRVDGVSARDWEDIAIDPETNELWIADFGNNCNCRTDLRLYRVAEPDPFGSGSSAQVMKYDFQYPDGSHNAESLFVWNGMPYVLIKQSASYLYSFPELDSSKKVTLVRGSRFDNNGIIPTGADISYDGKRLVIVNHGLTGGGHHWILERSASSNNVNDFFSSPTNVWHFTFVNQQTESVSFINNTYSVITASEQRTMWRIDPWFYEAK